MFGFFSEKIIIIFQKKRLRSKYCLEISIARERLKNSGWPFHSSKIFGVFLVYLRFVGVRFLAFYYRDIAMIVKKGLLEISV